VGSSIWNSALTPFIFSSSETLGSVLRLLKYVLSIRYYEYDFATEKDKDFCMNWTFIGKFISYKKLTIAKKKDNSCKNVNPAKKNRWTHSITQFNLKVASTSNWCTAFSWLFAVYCLAYCHIHWLTVFLLYPRDLSDIEKKLLPWLIY
jgi:hypothetical protein